MVSSKLLWGNVLMGGKLQIDARNSNFETFESALYEISEYAFNAFNLNLKHHFYISLGTTF